METTGANIDGRPIQFSNIFTKFEMLSAISETTEVEDKHQRRGSMLNLNRGVQHDKISKLITANIITPTVKITANLDETEESTPEEESEESTPEEEKKEEEEEEESTEIQVEKSEECQKSNSPNALHANANDIYDDISIFRLIDNPQNRPEPQNIETIIDDKMEKNTNTTTTDKHVLMSRFISLVSGLLWISTGFVFTLVFITAFAISINTTIIPAKIENSINNSITMIESECTNQLKRVEIIDNSIANQRLDDILIILKDKLQHSKKGNKDQKQNLKTSCVCNINMTKHDNISGCVCEYEKNLYYFVQNGPYHINEDEIYRNGTIPIYVRFDNFYSGMVKCLDISLLDWVTIYLETAPGDLTISNSTTEMLAVVYNPKSIDNLRYFLIRDKCHYSTQLESDFSEKWIHIDKSSSLGLQPADKNWHDVDLIGIILRELKSQ